MTAEVLAANEAFYAAVEAGDLDRLTALCSSEHELVCVHPGVGPIHGTGAVLRSWAMVMASLDYVQFFLTDVHVTLQRDGDGEGDVAVVTCTENILTAGEEEGEEGAAFRGGKAQALNVFTRERTGWRMWIHQASPVGSDGI